MFNEIKDSLFERKSVNTKSTSGSITSKNAFLKSAVIEGSKTLSGNGALKYSTTTDPFVDQFGILGSFKVQRSYQDISRDFDVLWGIDKSKCVKFALYLRAITRNTSYINGDNKRVISKEPQRGAELKHEAICRFLHLHEVDKVAFWQNIGLLVSVGSYRDIFEMLRYDLMYHGWDGRVLDWDAFAEFLAASLIDENVSNLVKKYLPSLKPKSKCTTVRSQANLLIAKWLCSKLFTWNTEAEKLKVYKNYRLLKASGKAHRWQQLISQKRMSELNFDSIAGRALSQLVKSRFLVNQGLSEKYSEWVASKAKAGETLKYTGFVHELFENLKQNGSQDLIDTINSQFQTLVDKGKSTGTTSLIVVRDTSASMCNTATGTKSACFNVAKALALYFSEFLTGTFSNSFIEFNSAAKMHHWAGDTPVRKWNNDRCDFVGSTNFQSVIDLFVSIRESGVDESEFPFGILCISDSEFDPGQLGKTNVDQAKEKLARVFSKEYVDNFIIVLWNLQSNYYGPKTGQKFETQANVPNTFYFSGYSPSVIAFLTGGKIDTPLELLDKALDQEVLNLVVV